MNSLNNLLHQDWVALTPAVISVAALYIEGGKVGTVMRIIGVTSNGITNSYISNE